MGMGLNICETSGTGHKLIFDTYFALKDQYERDEVWM